MGTRLIIGIIILILCCILAFLIPLAPPGKIIIQDNCKSGICPAPEEMEE